MKYIRKPEIIEVIPYKEGMEHGFDYLSIGDISVPYFNDHTGRHLFVREGDMLILHQDGFKQPITKESLDKYYIEYKGL